MKQQDIDVHRLRTDDTDAAKSLHTSLLLLLSSSTPRRPLEERRHKQLSATFVYMLESSMSDIKQPGAASNSTLVQAHLL